MIILLFLGMIVYIYFGMKIIDFVLNRTKSAKGSLLALALALFPLVVIIQLIVSFGIVK